MSACNTNWFAVFTKPRQETIAMRNLERQSFECYLPMAAGTDRQRSSGSKIRHEPLFPRYLFLNADPQRQSLDVVRSTRGASGLVRAGVELIKIPESIIADLKERMHPATGLIPLDSAALDCGDRVRVCDGPLASLEGVFKEHQGQTRSMLLLDILGRQTRVRVDPRILQRVN